MKIQMIAISSVIGVTIFYGDGEALEVAGPSGAFLAFGIVGFVAICVMEGISEMIQMFPTPNALMEFVRAFVDPDLAWVVGVAYW
jgi:amino acid transporter